MGRRGLSSDLDGAQTDPHNVGRLAQHVATQIESWLPPLLPFCRSDLAMDPVPSNIDSDDIAQCSGEGFEPLKSEIGETRGESVGLDSLDRCSRFGAVVCARSVPASGASGGMGAAIEEPAWGLMSGLTLVIDKRGQITTCLRAL